MFTGLIEAVGRIAEIDARDRDRRLRIEPGGALMADLETGASVAVAGACLTAVDPDDSGFHVDISAETLALTTLGELDVYDTVNLERALLPTTRLGGHLVAGHVDGIGRIAGRTDDGRCWRFTFEVPAALARYLAVKGSVCVDGVSLTINEVDGSCFGVNIIPHTMAVTTLGTSAIGDWVNIEVDLVARYLESLLRAGDEDDAAPSRARELPTRLHPREAGGE